MFNSSDTSGSQAPHSVPGGLAFGVPNTNLRELDAALTALETIESDSRRLQAARVTELARIDRAARLEAATGSPAVQAGTRAAEDSMAYRAARADTATALHLSEQTAAAQLARAATLVSAYPTMTTVLAAGEIDMRHVAVMMDAGQVIGPVVLPGERGPGLLDAVSQAIVDTNRAAFEARVLAEAVKTTPGRLAPVARRIAEAYALEDLETRYERARTQRAVWLIMKDDGMAEIGALLPVHEAKAVESRLTLMAKRAGEADDRREREVRKEREARETVEARGTEGATGVAPGDDSTTERAESVPRRTRNEIKADLFVDLLLNGTGENASGGPGSGTGITAMVQVITHEGHLTEGRSEGLAEGHTNDLTEYPADTQTNDTGTQTLDGGHAALSVGAARLPFPELEGCGPIPVSMARDLAAKSGSWSNVKVDLRTGTVLTVDTYRPSERIRRFLVARDQRCRFPGCRVSVHRCDFDHTVDAALGGPTSTMNLGALCRGHHLLKHHSGWVTEQHQNGDYEWTSPTGRLHVDEPVSRVRFVSVEDLPEYGAAPPEPRVSASRELNPQEPEHQESDPRKTEPQGTTPPDTREPLGPQPF